MTLLVGSNVLLDVMTEDARWFAWSAEALERAADTERLVINPVTYAEVSVRYRRIEDSRCRTAAHHAGARAHPV